MDSDNTRFDAPRAPKLIPAGFYTGRIKCNIGPIATNPSYREVFSKGKLLLYLDLEVTLDQVPDTVLTVGYSNGELDKPRAQGGKIIKNPVITGELGKLVSNWVKIDENFNQSVTQVLNGKEIAFMVRHKPGTKNPAIMYPYIVKESVVPKGQAQPGADPYTGMPPSSPPPMPQRSQSQFPAQPGQYPGNYPYPPQQ